MSGKLCAARDVLHKLFAGLQVVPHKSGVFQMETSDSGMFTRALGWRPRQQRSACWHGVEVLFSRWKILLHALLK